MITRAFNLIFASGMAFLTYDTVVKSVGQFDWTVVIFALVAIFWLTGAVGLFFRSRLAWCGSLLGVGTMLSGSITMVCTGWRLMPVSSDPSDGVGFMLIFGFLGLVFSLFLIVGLLGQRSACFSPAL
ncbi:MAG TPA: hypothetical protein VK327_13585 [Candidatus Paceibacterota bacterium]|nr:hypothetical protein [Candidatus Paceibacterota bacterium]